MCKDPKHHAYRSGPRVGRVTGWIVLGAISMAMWFCPACWRGRLQRFA